MKKIYFLRSASYDYRIPGMDLYDSFNAVIKKEITPELTETKEEFIKRLPGAIVALQTVFSSPDKRCLKTAGFLTHDYQSIDLLAEVRYVMDDFIKKDEFFKNGEPQVDKARILFVKGLISNSLQESYTSVMDRVMKLHSFINKQKSHEIVCISHGLMLKIVEAYFQNNDIVKKPSLLQKYFDGKTQPFSFGKGFRVDLGEDLVEVSYF